MTFQYWGATIKRVDTPQGLRYHVWLPGQTTHMECLTMPAATAYVYSKCALSPKQRPTQEMIRQTG